MVLCNHPCMCLTSPDPPSAPHRGHHGQRLMMDDVGWLDLHPWVTSASCWPSLSLLLPSADIFECVLTPGTRLYPEAGETRPLPSWTLRPLLKQINGIKANCHSPGKEISRSPGHQPERVADVRAAGKGENLSRELRNEKRQSCENQRKQKCTGPPIPHQGRGLKHCLVIPGSKEVPSGPLQEKSEDLGDWASPPNSNSPRIILLLF